MTTSQRQPVVRPELVPPPRKAPYRGEVVYLYAFDVAQDMKRDPVWQLLGQPVSQFEVDVGKRSPRELFFYRPQMVNLPAVQCDVHFGGAAPQVLPVSRSIKLFPVGAISISFHVPFEVADLPDLVAYHDLYLSDVPLHEEARRLAQAVREELKPYFIRASAELRDEEAYTVFCLEAPLEGSGGLRTQQAEGFLREHRRQIAALLTQEPDPARLSEQEADDTTTRYLSYYDNDLIVVDWDAAMIVDDPRNFTEVLHIMELANVQLAELEAYDRILDDSIDRAYRDLSRRRWRGRSRGEVLRELRELRIDLARLSDELLNITKFFGDWHLARLYQHLGARFHLADWHHTIEDKLKTLDDLYRLLQQDRTNRWMMILEATIVLLFIIDLVVLFSGRG